MVIRVDQGSQFTSKELDLLAYANGVTLDFSRRGKLTDNAYAESCQRHWRSNVWNLDDAREKVDPDVT
jgi:putative transposase